MIKSVLEPSWLLPTKHDTKTWLHLKPEPLVWSRDQPPQHICVGDTLLNVLISLGFRLITELAERSPIIKQNTSNPSSQKNLDVWPHDCTTIQGATFNMRGQLYRRHANAMALFSSPVVSALGSKSDYPGSSPTQGKALCPWDVQEKKKCEFHF